MLCSDLRSCNSELFLAIPFDEAVENAENIKSYVFDVAAYVLNTLGRELSPGITIPPNKLAPNGWPSAILFDEPLGEDQRLSCFHVGQQHIDLIWLIPIFQNEYTEIKSQGLQRFYELDEQSEMSLVDVFRSPVL